MIGDEKIGRFDRKVVFEGKMPQVYLVSTSEKVKASSNLETSKDASAARSKSAWEGGFLKQEDKKRWQFLEQRNAAQEKLFTDILSCHQQFGTGLKPGDLWRLHDTLAIAASKEHHCSAGDSIHIFVECKLLDFMREKAVTLAWQKLSASLIRFQLAFPFPPSLEDPEKPENNDMIKEESKKAQGDQLAAMSTLLLAELILGNVPTWVFSYPQKDNYLWLSTTYQGVAAGLAADLYVKFLYAYERNAEKIITDIEKVFAEKLDVFKNKGPGAPNLAEVLSVSRLIDQMTGQDISEDPW